MNAITTAAPVAGRCLRCNRPLKSARSLADGMGRTCKAHVARAAKQATAKPAQVAKAVELIEVGGIIPLRARRVFRTVSSDGTHTYLTAATGQCNCPAGLKGRGCYHVLGVQLLAAA